MPVIVDIKDVLGRTIWSKQIVPNDNPANWIIPVDQWEAGMYFIIGSQGTRSAKAPFVVKYFYVHFGRPNPAGLPINRLLYWGRFIFDAIL